MQWTQIDIGRRLFWLVNALVLLIVLALVIALAVSDEGWYLVLNWSLRYPTGTYELFVWLSLLLMVSGAIREPSEQIRWRVLRFVAWWYVVYGTGTLCIDIVFVGPGPLQLGNVLAILAGVLTLHRKPFAAWMYLAFHVSALLMQLVFAREDALTGRLIETLSEGLGVVLAAAIFILVQKVFRAPADSPAGLIRS